jgi:Sulfotransferase domain
VLTKADPRWQDPSGQLTHDQATDGSAQDIAFISFPKSGRTWMRYVFHLVGYPVHFTHAGHGTSRREMGEPFVDLNTWELRSKNIFLHRNPLDTAVSLYFQMFKKDFRFSSHAFFGKFLKLAIRGQLPPRDMNRFVLHPLWGVEKICRFNRAWIDFLDSRPHDLVISYERARANPEAAIRQVLGYCRVSGDATKLATLASFESMRARELTEGRSRQLMLHGMTHDDPETMKIRRGVVRGYRDYLQSDVIARAREIAARYRFDI